LAALSSLLQNRLELYQPLLNLSGRLDLALAQISMRRIAAENMASQVQGKNGAAKYVEGESSDEDSEEEDDEVGIEAGEEGEIEDIDMRGMDSDGSVVSFSKPWKHN
jgi:U3 small nucleolar RNA-associated protein 5